MGVLQDGIGCWPGGLEWGGGEGKVARGGLSKAVNGGWACGVVGREKLYGRGQQGCRASQFWVNNKSFTQSFSLMLFYIINRILSFNSFSFIR